MYILQSLQLILLWTVFVSLADDCQITCLLGCFDQICVGTSEGTIVMLSANNGQLLQRFSMHSHQVRVLLELPQIIKPCICAELPVEIESPLKETKTRSRTSLPIPPVQDEFFTFTIPKRSRGNSLISDRSKINMKLDSNYHGKHPLFASIGDGLAKWFGNGSEMDQNLEFLTWTDDFL